MIIDNHQPLTPFHLNIAVPFAEVLLLLLLRGFFDQNKNWHRLSSHRHKHLRDHAILRDTVILYYNKSTKFEHFPLTFSQN